MLFIVKTHYNVNYELKGSFRTKRHMNILDANWICPIAEPIWFTNKKRRAEYLNLRRPYLNQKTIIHH